MTEPQGSKLKKQLSTMALLMLYVGVLAYLSQYVL